MYTLEGFDLTTHNSSSASDALATDLALVYKVNHLSVFF
jgi:hypothetical protein